MPLKPPILFINFKTYEEATGKKAVELAKKAEEVASEEKAAIILVVQAADLRLVSKSVKLPVFAQHIDPVQFGNGTGSILPESVKLAGAVGTVLNHAENKRSNTFIQKAIARAKPLNLSVMVCAESLKRAKEIAGFGQKPDFIAIEPPELIGGNASVSTAKPKLVLDGANAVKETAPRVGVITGAGIKSRADVAKALELGTQGIFVASGIVKAANQKEAIRSLVKGFKQ